MEIPSRYNPSEVEGKIYRFWVEKGYFSAKNNSKNKPFTIAIPPPNITGILHMGHALNDTIQDVLIRYKRMNGYEALWIPGTDHAGIATQNVVEKKIAKEGLTKEGLGREEFVRRLWDWRNQYGLTIINQLKKLGASCDWERLRFTLDNEYSEAVKEVFIRLFNEGLIYRGNYIINWCPRCKTALSDEESPRKEIDGWLYYIKYPIKDSASKEDYVVVATTRPETMLGDTAIAVNPKDGRYQHLLGKTVILPLIGRELKVIADDLIEKDFGTGVVKVTPAHDPADYIMGKKHNLAFINIFDENAVINENGKDFAGMDRFEARQAIVDILKEKKLLVKEEPYKISAGHCYRCHTIIEPRLSLQWFVKMKPLAKKAIEAVEEDKIKFYPSRWKKVYLNWMNNIQDWCISRQIWWGHRIPVWYCSKCSVKLEASGIAADDSWREGVIVSKSKPDKCPKCGSTGLYQDADVLDTWFSSWLWPFAALGWPEKNPDLEYFYPTNVLVTASEILFFWVARMIMAGIKFTGKIPFSEVIIHGTVRDEKGVKMSKSLGNTIDPQEVIDKFGADSLRFSLMMLAASGADVYLSDEKFLAGRNFANKIWNASRYIILKAKEEKFSFGDFNFSPSLMDKWIIKEFNMSLERFSRHIEKYRFNEAAKEIYDFIWHKFCDWYIEITKDNFNENTAKILLFILVQALKMLHPFMPYLTEDIFQILKREFSLPLEDALIISHWPKPVKLEAEEKENILAEELIQLISQIRALRSDLGIPSGEKINVSLKIKDEFKHIFTENEEWAKRLSFTAAFRFLPELKRRLISLSKVSLDLDFKEADIQKYKTTLEKKIQNLSRVISAAQKKLDNKNFIERAPREIVEKEQKKLNDFRNQLSRIKIIKNALEQGT